MENQPITNPSDISSANSVPVNQPSIQPQTDLMMPVVVTLLVSAVIFGFGGYYFGKRSSTSQSQNLLNQSQTDVTPSISSSPISITPSSIPALTSDKVSYANSEYGFSIQFPQGFTTQVQAAGAETQVTPPNASNFYIYKVGDTESYLNRYINFEVLGLEPSYPAQWTRTQTTVGGKTLTKLTDSSKASNFDIYLVNLNNNQGIIEIYVSNAPDKSSTAMDILSTFKFTN